jgi:hypothetical protein
MVSKIFGTIYLMIIISFLSMVAYDCINGTFHPKVVQILFATSVLPLVIMLIISAIKVIWNIK